MVRGWVIMTKNIILPLRDWTQDFFHHCQMFPVIVGLE